MGGNTGQAIARQQQKVAWPASQFSLVLPQCVRKIFSASFVPQPAENNTYLSWLTSTKVYFLLHKWHYNLLCMVYSYAIENNMIMVLFSQGDLC